MRITMVGVEGLGGLPPPDKVDRRGGLWKKSTVVGIVKSMVSVDDYFFKKAKYMLTDTEKAIEKTEKVSAEYTAVIDRFVATEIRLADESKRVAGSVKASADRLGQGIDRLQKAADFERLERYVDLLERSAVAMQALAELEASGRLEKIASAIRSGDAGPCGTGGVRPAGKNRFGDPLMAERKPLLDDQRRCGGDAFAHKCQTCARREQIVHDDQNRYYPFMCGQPNRDGTCIYWIEEVTG